MLRPPSSTPLSTRGLPYPRTLSLTAAPTHHSLPTQPFSFLVLLKACAKNKDLHGGRAVHAHILKAGLFPPNPYLGSSLVSMYAKCGDLAKSQAVFDELSVRDSVCWNALIAGYAQQGRGHEALDCFQRMQKEGFAPNPVTFCCILRACACARDLIKGKVIHDAIVENKLLRDNVILGTALVDMYAKCGALEKAKEVFDGLDIRNVVCWNALIAGYAQQGQSEHALSSYDCMLEDGIRPDSVTYICVLKACASAHAIDKGKQIHEAIVKDQLLGKDIALGTALIDMYAKCGDLTKSQEVFDLLPVRDGICWDALITGYAQHDQAEQVLYCYEQMQKEGFAPDPVTFSCILKACASMGAVDKGAQLHEKLVEHNLLAQNVVLGTALVDMYSKCGALAKAQQVFDKLVVRDVASWTALIAGYAQWGCGHLAVESFEQMQKEGFFPDPPTFLCVLNACNHSGLVDKGETYFIDMTQKYCLTPGLDHYACMVGLLSRAGHFEKALAMIEKIQLDDNNLPVWLALLDACRAWGNVEVGRLAFERALQIDGTSTTAYVLMSNTYVAAGMRDEAEKVEVMRVQNNVP